MLLRLRWFALGALSVVSGGVYVVGKMRRARERLTAANFRRTSGHALADALGAAARRLAPDGPEGAAG